MFDFAWDAVNLQQNPKMPGLNRRLDSQNINLKETLTPKMEIGKKCSFTSLNVAKTWKYKRKQSKIDIIQCCVLKLTHLIGIYVLKALKNILFPKRLNCISSPESYPYA